MPVPPVGPRLSEAQALCSTLRQVDLDAPSVPESLRYSVLAAELIAEGESDLVQRSGGVLSGKIAIEPGQGVAGQLGDQLVIELVLPAESGIGGLGPGCEVEPRKRRVHPSLSRVETLA